MLIKLTSWLNPATFFRTKLSLEAVVYLRIMFLKDYPSKNATSVQNKNKCVQVRTVHSVI